MLRQLFLRILSIGFGLALFFIGAEIVFRFLPVNEGLGRLAVNAENLVVRFQPDRVSTWSDGWNFSIVNEVRTNNFGFVNGQDYDPEADSPLLAVVGDSYVEAAMVPFTETLQGRLQGRVKDRGRVYSFGASGLGLGSYLAYAEYAQKTFRPDGMVFVIIRNDFKESLYKYEKSPTQHYFDKTPDGKVILRRVDYEPSTLRKILRHSKLAMYLITNVGLHRGISIPIPLGKGDVMNHIPGEVSVVGNEDEFKSDAKEAIGFFFDFLPKKSGLAPEKILFVVDGDRPALYEAETFDANKDGLFQDLRSHFIATATRLGYGVADLQPAFAAEFAQNGEKFEFPRDSHWNGAGHGVAAENVAVSSLFREVFGLERSSK